MTIGINSFLEKDVRAIVALPDAEADSIKPSMNAQGSAYSFGACTLVFEWQF